MLPLGAVVSVKPSIGPDRVMHYNAFPRRINGVPPGYSSGQSERQWWAF